MYVTYYKTNVRNSTSNPVTNTVTQQSLLLSIKSYTDVRTNFALEMTGHNYQL